MGYNLEQLAYLNKLIADYGTSPETGYSYWCINGTAYSIEFSEMLEDLDYRGIDTDFVRAKLQLLGIYDSISEED